MTYNQTLFNECMEANRGRAPGYSMICLGEDTLLLFIDMFKYLAAVAVIMIIVHDIYKNVHLKQNPEAEYNRLNTLD
ncbi:hypothetical protein Lmor_0169 [Legionella moravica]|uniref:Uncharacterized protein n=1 Tax=Legionella moravica TaxID=39962 RepID=A0A378JR06_9GAMM|nr:hypothetical protein [Legionella moravica]KTD39057.1 hypothetical protein Lmor_0169 [Legionella moravica]STX61145.1 Uncharacterised protein [Legionella moravica]